MGRAAGEDEGGEKKKSSPEGAVASAEDEVAENAGNGEVSGPNAEVGENVASTTGAPARTVVSNSEKTPVGTGNANMSDENITVIINDLTDLETTSMQTR